jgi:hypothetical protein
MTTKVYAGIGSRDIPIEERARLTQLATELEKRGYKLRSGGADGSDRAFAEGVQSETMVEVVTALHATPAAMEIAKRHHPAWHRCSDYAKKLLGRNTQIVLGKQLTAPVRFVMAWTQNPNQGGTSIGIKIARAYHVPLLNLAACASPVEDALAWVDRLEAQ